jgi:hypothetical protein
MKRFLLVTVFAAALCAGYASSALLAGIYGSWCDPDTIGNPCPSVCGGGVGNVCPAAYPCTAMFTGTYWRHLCVDAFGTTCDERPCSDPVRGIVYSCGGAGLAPCECPAPPGTC